MAITFKQAFEGRYGYDKPYKAMTADLKDRVTIVTGGYGIIGAAISELAAQCGAIVIVAGHNGDKAEAEAEKIRKDGGKAMAIKADFADRASMDAMVRKVIDTYGRIDNLICNAGINASTKRGPITTFVDEDIPRNMETNLNGGCVYLCKLCIPYMIKQGGGNIVNTTSVCGVTGLRNQCGFVASKFGMSAITKSMAAELGKYNIRVNALAPGSLPFPEAIMRGDSNWSAASNWDHVDLEDYDKNFINPRSMLFDIPARRPAFPSEMAGLVVYLISDDATYTTGQVISVDGGWTACYSGDY